MLLFIIADGYYNINIFDKTIDKKNVYAGQYDFADFQSLLS